jgi:hypothetical protein
MVASALPSLSVHSRQLSLTGRVVDFTERNGDSAALDRVKERRERSPGQTRFAVMVQPVSETLQATQELPDNAVVPDWKAILRGEIEQAIERGGGRWSRALMAVAWIHVCAFLVCHALNSPRQERDPRHIAVWFVELVAVFIAMRIFAGKGWFWSPQAIHLIGRMWLTLLILSFSLSTLNATIGWQTLWFKAAWGTLSSFFFATLAWLITYRFLFFAFQMYFTALLMARFMDWNNVIYGASWWLALMVLAWNVRQRERRGSVSRA